MRESFYARHVKRPLDVVLALLSLPLALLPLTFCYLLMKLEAPRSRFLFSQLRNGRGGREFRMYKIRTMRSECCSGNEIPGAENMSRVGRLIRRTSFDEIPQLYNILRGEMSFIGPRPLPAAYYPYFDERERVRFAGRPGITGLAQVSGRATLDWSKRIALDIQYVENITWRGDLKLLGRTLLCVFRRQDVMVAGDGKINFNDYKSQEEKSG